MATKKKIDLAKEAAMVSAGAEVQDQITDAFLREICPKNVLARFKGAKTPAAKADLLFDLDRTELKALREAFKEMDNFLNKLEAWFVQEFRDDQRGVTGKVGRVEIKSKEIASVEDWTKFYGHIAKKKEFDLLNKAVNQKAVQARWEENKQIPGVGKFVKKVVSLTAVKGK